MVAELKNLGETGRKALVEAWSGFLPKYGDPPFQSGNGQLASLTNGSNNSGHMSHSSSTNLSQHLVDEEEEDR